jgi:excisionase family DNA binding protein
VVKEKLLTVAEVAEYLSVSDQTVRRWIKEKKLPAFKLDRELRVRESDLEAFLEARRVQGDE